MQLICTHCQRTIEYAGEPPRFCGWCGQTLVTLGPAATAEYAAPSDPAFAPTLAPHEPASANVHPAVPKFIGNYHLLRTLGGGGMGTVYEAEERGTGRHVALKLIAPQFTATRDAVERFRQEGRLASVIAHPRCVFVVAADEDQGRPYIVMELMPGTTLDDLVKQRGPRPPLEAVQQILDVIGGLREAHRLGVIHRDVKPNNCFLEADGRVKIGDFGLSKSLVSDQQLTKTGSFLGTPMYASPEQIRGEAVDHQTDVYSTAATLYFLLTGRAPFQSGDAMATLARIASDDAPSLRSIRPEITGALDQIVLRGLERDRRKRWQSLEDFETALRNLLPGRLSVGGLGIRLAAFFLDTLIGSLIIIPMNIWFSSHYDVDEFADAYAQVVLLPARIVLGLTFWPLYFGITEGLWGGSPAKLLLGLRVRRTATADPPGVLRATLRALVVTIAGELYGSVVVLALAFKATPGMHWEQLMQFSPLLWCALTFNVPASMGVAMLLLWWPMRRRNGYRQSQDFLFDTVVVAQPTAVTQHVFPVRSLRERVLQAGADVPTQLGPFRVEGVLRQSSDAVWLLGWEPTLQRTVLLWLRPLASPPLSVTRRELSRTTRPRWLAAGETPDERWDAFIAGNGATVAELIKRGQRCTWLEVRGVLEQLLEELTTASSDGTVPANLGMEHVWIQADGRTLLLDEPLTRDESERDAPQPAGLPARELVRQVALGLLQGDQRGLEPPASVGVVLPLHVRAMLDQLNAAASPGVTLTDLAGQLAATRNLPTTVTRGRRAAQLALLVAFLWLPVGLYYLVAFNLCLFPAMELHMRTLQRKTTGERLQRVHYADAVTMLNHDPWMRIQGCMTLERDRWLQQVLDWRIARDARLRELARETGSPTLPFAEFVSHFAANQPGFRRALEQRLADDRQQANLMAFHVLVGDPEPKLFWVLLGWCAFLPSVWAAWAFAFRGGLSLRATGLVLVRSNGEPASRLQCAWRSLACWLPVMGLLLLFHELTWRFWVRLDAEPPPLMLGWQTTLCWWSVVALPVVWLVLALLMPTRSLHDRLAGTRLVPR